MTMEYGHHPTKQWAAALKRINRFGTMEMTHRTNDLIHAKRVHMLSLVFATAAKDAGFIVDMDKVSRLSLHHDDGEVVTTDIPSPVKRAMTDKERADLRRRELEAAEIHADMFTTLPRSTYLADQKEIHMKATTESQIVDIADKIDGVCETIHEIRAGSGEIYLDVLENYQIIFEDFTFYAVFNELGIQIPTPEETVGMKRVTTDLLKEGQAGEFWETVFDDALPEFYKVWMKVTMGEGRFRTLAKSIALFPGWEDELRAIALRDKGINNDKLIEEVEISSLG